MVSADAARQAHAAARARRVVERYLHHHPDGLLRKKIESGGLTMSEAYTLLKEVSVDPKTGVDRADLLPLILEYEIQGALQHHWPLSVAVLDIDDFKKINTELTHLGADHVLKEIAQLLRNATRDSDEVVLGDQSIVRWGGEEFVTILVHADRENAIQVSERLRQSVEKSFIGRRPNEQLITVSIGVAQWDKQTMNNWQDLLRQADRQLFAAKQAGKNKVVG